jgi:hypothetical protein
MFSPLCTDGSCVSLRLWLQEPMPLCRNCLCFAQLYTLQQFFLPFVVSAITTLMISICTHITTACCNILLTPSCAALLLYTSLCVKLHQGKAAWTSLPVSMPAAGAAAVVQCSECGASPAVSFCEQCNGAALCSQCDNAVHKAGTTLYHTLLYYAF